MSIEPDESITRWLGALKEGDPTAAKALWNRYFRRLVRLAWAKLRAAHHPGTVEDEEDAALSAFDSFCAGATRGQFAQVDDRDDLWSSSRRGRPSINSNGEGGRNAEGVGWSPRQTCADRAAGARTSRTAWSTSPTRVPPPSSRP